jgi:ABC-type glycerol-3-phosphate transport system substrate-binding protein
MILKKVFTGILILFLLAACAPLPVPTPRVTASPEPTGTPTTLPVPTSHVPGVILRIWVTPRFDPTYDAMLKARMDEFAAGHTGLQIEVRVKDESALIESLRLTSSAAPGAAPDLVVFSRAELESAVAAGLVPPVSDESVEVGSLLPVARLLGQIKQETFGVPFALEALTLATSSQEEVPPDWGEISKAGTVVFNINDASFPLGLYLSAGGKLTGVDGGMQLDEDILVRVLTLFAGGKLLGVESDEQAAAIVKQGSNVGVAWTGSFLLAAQESSVRLAAVPGLDSPSATIVTGWNWSVTSTDSDRRELALELVKWLTVGKFVGDWVPSLGLLPPYADERWQSLLEAGLPVPPAEMMDVAGPILEAAVKSVLNGVTPEAAAQTALEALK